MKMRIAKIYEGLIEEGTLVGTPALFFAVAGCNLACRWCDAREASGAQGTEMSVAELVERASRSHCRHIVITGGEPALYKGELDELVDGLHDCYRKVVVESNAMEHIDCMADLFSLSPKLRSSQAEGQDIWPAETIARYAAEGKDLELKVVVADELDFQEALIKLSQHQVPRSNVLLMPQSETEEEYRDNAAWLAGECAKYGFRLGLRLKYALGGK